MRTFRLHALQAIMIGGVLVCGLAACQREPNFDERYRATTRSIVDQAKEIDRQIAATQAPTGTPPEMTDDEFDQP